jgi:PKD domain
MKTKLLSLVLGLAFLTNQLDAQCCISSLEINQTDLASHNYSVTALCNQPVTGVLFINGNAQPLNANTPTPEIYLAPGYHTICAQMMCIPIPCAACTSFRIHPNIIMDGNYSISPGELNVEMPEDTDNNGTIDWIYQITFNGMECNSSVCNFPLMQVGTFDLCVTSTSTDDGTFESFCIPITIECGNISIDFTHNATGSPGELQFFAPGSLPFESWWWDFGDGTGSSELNPLHTYTAAGLYQVCLLPECDDEVLICQTVDVCTWPSTIETDIDGEVLTLGFFDPGSQPFDGNIYLTWGDGTDEYCDDGMTAHTYTRPAHARYSVYETCDSDGNILNEYDIALSRLPCPCCPGGQIPWTLISNASDHNASLYVDETGSGAHIVIDWGDGTVDGTDSNKRTHQYADCGPYTVTITIFCGEAQIETSSFTTTFNWCPPDLSGFIPIEVGTVEITDQHVSLSLGPGVDNDDSEVVFTVNWGDGSPSEPCGEGICGHDYLQSGTYEICATGFTISSSEPATICWRLEVGPTCMLPTDFATVQDVQNPNQYYFWPIPLPVDEDGLPLPPPCVIHPQLQLEWTFNGETVSDQAFVSRIMEEEGIYYYFSLSATCLDSGSSTTIEHSVIADPCGPGCNANAAFSYSHDLNSVQVHTNAEEDTPCFMVTHSFTLGDNTFTGSNPTIPLPAEEIAHVIQHTVTKVNIATGETCVAYESVSIEFPCMGDLDGNGTRNVSDLLMMMANFGQDCTNVTE